MFALVALLVFTLIGAGLFWVLSVQLDKDLRTSLDNRAEIARLIVYPANTPEKWNMVREKLTDLMPRDGSTRFYVQAPDPAFQFGVPLIDHGHAIVPGDYQIVSPRGSAHQMLAKTLVVCANKDRPAVQLVAAVDCTPNRRTMRVFALALAALSALGSLAVLLLSHGVARLGLTPLARLSRDASRIRPDNRSQRLDTHSLPHELRHLADSFNGALQRLEDAYARLESFNADVAHELRTPVTILVGQTEVMLARERSAEQFRHTLQSNLEEFKRMRTIINDMLFLARADQGERATGLVEVALAQEVAHTLEYLEISFEEAQLSARLHGDAHACVNRSLFGRALTNLLINAIHHCASGTTIDVTIAEVDQHVRISVANRGEAIEPARLHHLFDRFYRGEASRTNSRANHGLGLSIVKAIAEMHRGTVFASSAGGINTFAFSVAARPSSETTQRALPAHLPQPQLNPGA
jgi:two-component system heavy metal sensor histidine kinase CusS